MERFTVGILAHVDAGKTTLSEAMLHLSGTIREMGRVDAGNSFLDNDIQERERGITIFSKQAVINYEDTYITLLDTPGHVDFSAEMERAMWVMDYAILVISASDGVQGHTYTLWKLLKRYGIPAFIFVNKMDQERTTQEEFMQHLHDKLGDGFVNFSLRDSNLDSDVQGFFEQAAVCDDELLERYLDGERISDDELANLIAERKMFPCFFGAAIKHENSGVKEFLDGLVRYVNSAHKESVCKSRTLAEQTDRILDIQTSRTLDGQTDRTLTEQTGRTLTDNKSDNVFAGNINMENERSNDEGMDDDHTNHEFGARVYKIAKSPKGERLTYMKLTSGVIRVKDIIDGEKADQLRIYSGEKYEAVSEVYKGQICAVTGLTKTRPGQGLGIEPDCELPLLSPVLTYSVMLPEDVDAHLMLARFKELEEEEPELHVSWIEETASIEVTLMGEVQIEIIRRIIADRYGVDVRFGAGNIVYKETINGTSYGVGHFEPLRHYAEVHLRFESGERGSGLCFAAEVSEDVLSKNWQRLVLTHLEEREYPGVLTGSDITDMKITLVAGRAHTKHTEGGDFRQATYRAVRQGLMEAESVLLEPYYEFRLEIPSDHVGRAMTDIDGMSGVAMPPEITGDKAVLTGSAPVSTMRDYQISVNSYTKGKGSLTCTVKGYDICHNEQEVIETIGYDPDSDTDNPSSSVFCSHGAGTIVPWYEVYEHMHAPRADQEIQDAGIKTTRPINGRGIVDYSIDEEQIEAIINRTSHANEKVSKNVYKKQKKPIYSNYKGKERRNNGIKYLIVDGYNIVHAWDELKELVDDNLDGARTKLMDILCNYQGYAKCEVILVFDAYKVKGNVGEFFRYQNINVVYTKEAQTADAYIEQLTNKMAKEYQVTVATSDGLVQLITRGQNCMVLSAREFRLEVERVNEAIREFIE